MAKGLEDIRKTLSRISQGENLLDMLCEMERTMDSLGLFAYQNWLEGELLDGPHVSKYWFKTTWMFKEEQMPDPAGAMRLDKIGCVVRYEKDVLKQPRKILTPADWANPKTKKAKIDDVNVYLVHIDMPIKYIVDGNDEIHGVEDVELEKDIQMQEQPELDDMEEL